jgi:hypothetical protein
MANSGQQYLVWRAGGKFKFRLNHAVCEVEWSPARERELWTLLVGWDERERGPSDPGVKTPEELPETARHG